MGNLSLDRSAAVRREVAIAIRDVPYDDSRFILLNLVKGYDGQDSWYVDALGKAADGKEEALFFDLRQTMPDDPADWDQRTANLVWELHPASAVNMLKKRAANPLLAAEARKQAIVTLGFIKTEAAAKAMLDLSKLTDKDVVAQAQYWLNFRRGNDWAKFLNWEQVMPTTVSAEEQKMLTNRQVLTDENTSDSEKRKMAVAMSRDAEGAKLLIGLAADGKLSEDLIKAAGPGIRTNKDQTVRTMGKEYFPWKRPASNGPEKASAGAAQSDADSTESTQTAMEKEPIKTAPVSTVPVQATPTEPTPSIPAKVDVASGNDPAIAQIAMLSGDDKKGLNVFKIYCANCHRYGQQGAEVGPELTQIHQKFDKNALIDNIIHPNAGIAFGYEPWLITTKKGQTYYGFLVSDGADAIVIKGVKGPNHTIPTEEVFSRRQYKTSLMPEPSAMGMTNQQLADLTAFLLKQ